MAIYHPVPDNNGDLPPVKYCACGVRILTKSNYCHQCARKANLKSRAARREKGVPNYDLYNYKWRLNNPKRYMWQTAKSRAKARNLDFNITEDDFDIPEYCPVLGIKLQFQSGKGVQNESPSIDRFDNTKGYVKGNVVVISWRANSLKRDGSLQEFLMLVEYLKNAKEG